MPHEPADRLHSVLRSVLVLRRGVAGLRLDAVVDEGLRDWVFVRRTPMNIPDLPPWFDNESDDPDEVSCEDFDTPYDE